MSGLWYPSLVVNLEVRFDEAMTGVTSDAKSAAGLAKGGDVAKTSDRAKTSTDGLTQIIGIIPRSGSCELPGYRAAGKFEFTIDYRDLPIDARVMRAVGVEVHLGAVKAEDFGEGMIKVESNGRRRSILQTKVAGGKTDSSTLLMTGSVDSVSVDHNQTSSTLKIEGRDQRGILLDSPINAVTLASIHLGKPINRVVEQIIGLHPVLRTYLAGGKKLRVVTYPEDWPNGVAIVANDSSLTRVNLGASGTSPSMPMKGNVDALNFWDVITQFCFLVGAVPYFVGPELRIRPAWSLYDRQDLAKIGHSVPSPFAGGGSRQIQTESGMRSQAVRLMIYGDNILTLKYERKLGGLKVPTIEVISNNTSSKQRGAAARILTARYPTELQLASHAAAAKHGGKPPLDLKGAKANRFAPSGIGVQEDVLRIPVYGVTNQQQMLSIAKALHQEIGRQELGGSISTKNLASFGGDNQDPDLLRLRPGDPVEIVVSANRPGSRAPIIAELISHSSRSTQEELDALT